MKRRIRKGSNVLVRLLAILEMVLMSACSRATPIAPTQASGSGNTTISFADLRLDPGIDYQTLANDFHQKNPSITVDILPYNLVQPADAAKQADVLFLYGTNPAEQHGFIALQPLLDAALDFKTDNLWPGSMTACSDAQGNPYGIPLVLSLQGIYYNPSFFDQYHVAYPQPGWTWSQFQQAVTQLGGVANGSAIYGFMDGAEGFLLEPSIEQKLQANNGQIDAQAMADSFRWYVQLATAKKLYPMPVNGANSIQDTLTLLKNGQAAMWTGSTETVGSSTASVQGVYLPYPVNQPEDHTTPVNVFCGAISAGTKNPQAAWAWLDFLSQQDLSGDKSRGLLPVRQSLTASSPYYASQSDSEKTALQYGLAHAWYSLPGVDNTAYTVLQAIATTIQSHSDLVGVFQALAAQANAPKQPTPTVPPVVLNTPQTTPTNLPPDMVSITFKVNTFQSQDPSLETKAEPALKALTADFEKLHPDIRVQYSIDVALPDEQHNFQVLAQQNDCFEFAGPGVWYQPFDVNDLLDLTSFLDQSPSLKNDFYPAFLAPFEKDGKIYGLPADADIKYMAYNADWLSSHGIPFPKPGWSLQDFLSLATQAADPNASKPVYGTGNASYWIVFNQGIHLYDATVQPPEATFMTDEMTQTFTQIKGLAQKGTLYEPVDITAFYKAVANGQVAFWETDGFNNFNFDGWDNASHPIYDQDLPFKVGFVPYPTLPSGRGMSQSGSGILGYYISGHTTQAKAKACWDWIQYLSDHPSLFGGYTPRQSVLPKEKIGQDPAQFAVVQQAIQQYNLDTFIDSANPLIGPYGSELAFGLLAVAGGKDVATTLAEAQQNSDAYRACIAQKDLTGLDSWQVYNLTLTCYTQRDRVSSPGPDDLRAAVEFFAIPARRLYGAY